MMAALENSCASKVKLVNRAVKSEGTTMDCCFVFLLHKYNFCLLLHCNKILFLLVLITVAVVNFETWINYFALYFLGGFLSKYLFRLGI